MRKFGIIGAMELEVTQLISHLENTTVTEKANMKFCQGILNGVPVVVVRSGIGKVNAAVCTQILISEFQADVIINTGIAGSLDAAIDIGDLVISTEMVHHDMDCVAFGYPLGQIPQMNIFAFPANPVLGELASKVSAKVNASVHTFPGRIVSGDQFVASKEKKDFIKTNFNGLCTEMEGASIGQAAWLNNVPFLILRAISDKADDSAQMDYPTFEHMAAIHCAAVVEGLVAEAAKASL